MKKFCAVFALFCAMFFFAACGGGSSAGSESHNQECTPGEFKCIGSESYYCNSLGSLVYDARCADGCNDATGKCNGDPELCGNRSEDPGEVCDGGAKECTEIDPGYTGGYAICKSDCTGWNTDDCKGTPVNPGNDNTDSGDSSDSGNDNDKTDSSDTSADLTCTNEGAFRCDGDLKQECKSGTWNTLEECNYGCDPVTQKCHGSTECKTGEYECIAGNLSYCNNNFWEIKEKCEYGCDAYMRQCLPKDCYTTRIYICGDSNEAGYSQASYYCENGVWHYGQTCKNGCDASTGQCNCDKINGKTWSDKVDSGMTWQNAKDYCDNLTACGYSDWHLPTISELRMLIQNCPATQTGGECGVTDSCLSSYECWNDACNGCSLDSSGKYSKLGDTYYFWSSSVLSDYSDYALDVGFGNGAVSSDPKSYTSSVRCVR